MHILLKNVESISLLSDEDELASDWIVIKTIQGDIYKTRGIISFTMDSLYGDLKRLV